MGKSILTCIILVSLTLNSCTIYTRAPVRLEDSIDKGRTKVEYDWGEPRVFREIIVLDSLHYGIIGKRKYFINPTHVNSVRLSDKKKSEATTIILGIPLVLIGLALYVFNSF